MENISKTMVDDVEYDISDDVARARIGDLGALKTDAKDDLVEAINEVKSGATVTAIDFTNFNKPICSATRFNDSRDTILERVLVRKPSRFPSNLR